MKPEFEWHTIIPILGTIILTIIAMGGVMVALLRGFFMTPKRCVEMQHVCQAGVCKKIDELKIQVEKDGIIISNNYAEIKGILGQIKGKLDID
jgi:hypothetical protein